MTELLVKLIVAGLDVRETASALVINYEIWQRCKMFLYKLFALAQFDVNRNVSAAVSFVAASWFCDAATAHTEININK